LRKRLEDQGAPWHQIEQQIFEVQEYRTHCPAQKPVPPRSVQCRDFKVYTYPSALESDKQPAIHKAVRQIMMDSPYATPDPAEACVIVPDIDVSCWCETCMHPSGVKLHMQHPVSTSIQENLTALPWWEEHSAKHLIFEFSDAPCLPWVAGNAIIAKVGLSEFHYRAGHDVSMPLFGMVDFPPARRRFPAAKRRFLLTFRCAL
jgi:hypothetical protein